jgi:hypothetical protein
MAGGRCGFYENIGEGVLGLKVKCVLDDSYGRELFLQFTGKEVVELVRALKISL